MTSEDSIPISGEEDRKTSSRDPEDTTLGSAELNDIEQNEEAGDVEAWNRAYDASTPSYELNLDAGIETEKKNEGGEEEEGSNVKK